MVVIMKNKEKQEVILYEEIANEIDYQSLPLQWQLPKLDSFSEKKRLYDYQIDALKNITKLLEYFYGIIFEYPNKSKYLDYKEAKKKFYNELIKKKPEIKSLELTSDNKAVKNLLSYYEFTEKKGERIINFYNFVNRASFWMATGSGKTLVIIKLIELINYLVKNNKIPNNDILFLTYKDNLIEQFKEHIEEYNEYNSVKINLYDLKDYDKVKFGEVLAHKDDINIFFYRSDLITDETKEKTLSFRDFENDGKWYVILDEAHKGDKEDSKRQAYYSFITRFGFLFNFSATFTDPWDIITTVFNFNLERFIKAGYGKNVYISTKNLNNFKEFDDNEKEKIVLKSLILLTAIKKAKEDISNKEKGLYHSPLMVIYGNSVNTDKSDLEIIFNVLARIAINLNIDNYKSAMDDLLDELKSNPWYAFKNDKFILNKNFISNIKYNDILRYVFNAETNAKIEAIKIPKNDEELILKLKSADKPFALIRIGDIGKWVKEKLQNYEITESYENESKFEKINSDDNTLNILMGSRTFYEGWDSNRPNVMMFINIGVADSKKYVMQSIGRGERIEPIKNMRMRLRSPANQNVCAKNLISKIEDYEISMLESLFVFGTNVDNIKQIIDSIKYEQSKSGYLIELEKNKDINNNLLLIPLYKEVEKPAINEIPKFSGNFEFIKNYIKWLSNDKILYTTYSKYLEPKDIPRLKAYIKEENFNLDNSNLNNSGNINIQMIDLINHIQIVLEDFYRFKEIENEIIHFKEINAILSEPDINTLKKKIDNVIGVGKQEEKLKELTKKHSNKEITDEEFVKEVENINWSRNDVFEKDNYKVKIKNLKNHYYIPVLIADDSKEYLISHIVEEKSEGEFIDKLDEYVNNNKVEANFWFFSKIDQTTDKVYIPYYNKKDNKEELFYPDFIFWIKKNKEYHIVFVDPKSTSYTDYEYKVDGYSRIFEENGKVKQFNYDDNLKVKVYLLLYTEDKNKLSHNYKKYWFDNPSEIFNIDSKDDN